MHWSVSSPCKVTMEPIEVRVSAFLMGGLAMLLL